MIKRAILAVAAVALADTASAQNVRVKGYVNKDGTYVMPHYRTAPDGKAWNNYSAAPNLNPYTGKVGTQQSYANPYAPKPYAPYQPYQPYKPL
jgi:hypothetical protein